MSEDIVKRLRWDKRYTHGHVPVTLDDGAKEIERLRSIIDEIHGWAVCYAIASPQDMAQNFPRIIEITDPLYPEMIDPEVPETIECHVCSEAAGANRPVYHTPPACK